MRIVHVVPALGKGGAERVAVDLANQQCADGHEVSLVAGWRVDEHLLRNEVSAGVRFEYMSSGATRLGRYLAGTWWIFRRRNWLFGQEIIHAHMTFAAVMATWLGVLRQFSRSQWPRVFETYHAVGMPIPRRQRWVHACLLARRNGVVLMADDPFWARYSKAHPDLPMRVIANGLAPPRIRSRADPEVVAYEDRAGLPASRSFTVGSIGRLVSERQPKRYLPLFARIADACGPDVHFVLAGDGPERSALAAAAEQLGVGGKLHMPGLAEDASLPRALIDLYVTVNVGPVTGLSGLEATSAGIPTIAFQLLDNYTQGENDWIWSSADPDALAAEAIRLITDPEARAATASRQAAYVRAHHGVEAMSAAYEDFYIAASPLRDLRAARAKRLLGGNRAD